MHTMMILVSTTQKPHLPLHPPRQIFKIYTNNISSLSPLVFKFPYHHHHVVVHSPRKHFRLSASAAHSDRPTITNNKRSSRNGKNHLRKKLIQQQVHHNPTTFSSKLVDDPSIFRGNYSGSIDNNNNNVSDADAVAAADTSKPPPSNNLNNQFDLIKQQDIIISHPTNNEKNNLLEQVKNSWLVHSSGKSGFLVDTIQSVTSAKPVTKLRISVFCGAFLVFFMAINTFSKKTKGDKEEYSKLDREMLRRKMKARMAKQNNHSIKATSTSSSVEVIQDSNKDHTTQMDVLKQRPQLDKQLLMTTIVNAKPLDDDSFGFDAKIQEIRTMARQARDVERKTECNGEDDVKNDDQTINNQHQPNEIIKVNSIDPTTSFDGDVTRIFASEDKSNAYASRSEVVVPNDNQGSVEKEENKISNFLDTEKEKLLDKKSIGSTKSRIITSVKEAREYLHHKKTLDDNKETTNKEAQVPSFGASHDSFNDTTIASSRNKSSNLRDKGSVFTINADVNDEKQEQSVKGSDAKVGGELGRADREKWVEDNFHEFEPLVEKIRGGFKNNYMVAREKVKDDADFVSELKMLDSDGEYESEFEWMKDDKLREIVFQVRENELMGRDPFYLMDAEDKSLFFKGLEKNVEKENEKLRLLHEYLHSNIENLDYGADGISLYDPPEKIIPRWKGPPPSTTMSQEFLDDYLDQRKALFAETLGNLDIVKSDSQIPHLQSSSNEKVEIKNLERSKTVIEGSDGSIKPGKKSGKEFWQHTKKWSRGFIDSYNAENDPETKAVMKEIGKDLDRWITEKEVQDAADIMDKVPDKGKKIITEKISKLKREMELFGPQAVVSKYSEYGDEEEIDYYWWLDLPFLVCIELYIDGDGDQRIGFYSLEMASDLELDPKPHHIIAFEDAGDCKNLCYIIQAHMEMIGNGNAFVVPQAPKDTYREAKANGFNVTVIRKGELKLDVDQTLEEVEERIVEIGSKMYHDKIMKGRNVDVDSVMKGVFGFKKPTNRRRSMKKFKKLKKPSK